MNQRDIYLFLLEIWSCDEPSIPIKKSSRFWFRGPLSRADREGVSYGATEPQTGQTKNDKSPKYSKSICQFQVADEVAGLSGLS